MIRTRLFILLAVAAAAIIASPGRGDDTYALIAGDIETARQMRDAGETGYSDMLRRCAARLRAIGELAEAVSVLTEVLEDPEHDFDRLFALRQRGQYRIASNQIDLALEDFEQIRRVSTDNPQLKTRYAQSHASALQQQAEILTSRGASTEAIAINEEILSPSVIDRLTEEVVLGACLRKGRLLEREGLLELAVLAYDELAAFPFQELSDPAQFMELLRHRAHLREAVVHGEGGAASPELIQELLAIWDNPVYAEHPRLTRVGLDLVDAMSSRHDAPERHEFALEVLTFIDTNSLDWSLRAASEDARTRLGQDTTDWRRTALSSLQSAHLHGRKDLTIFALRELIAIAQSDQSRMNLTRELHRLTSPP